MITTQNAIDRYAAQMEIVHDFFRSFSPGEAHNMLHKMMRAAFTSKDVLSKRDVLDLIFLKMNCQN